MGRPLIARAHENRISLSVKDQNGLKKQYFAIARPGVPVSQNIKCKKNAEFRGESFLGGRIFPPSTPSTGQITFFCFPLGISLIAKGCPRPKWTKTPSTSRFPACGGPVGQKVKGKKAAECRQILRKFSGGRIFSPNVPLAPGNCVFVVF